jgi:hypothetical protein
MKILQFSTKIIVGLAVSIGIFIGVMNTPSANAGQFNRQQPSTTLKLVQKPIQSLDLDALEAQALESMRQDDPEAAELFDQYLVEYDALTNKALGDEGDDPQTIENANAGIDALVNGKYKDVIDLYQSYYDQLINGNEE